MRIAIDARAAIWYRGTGIGTYTFQILRNLLPISDNIMPIYPENCKAFNILAEESYSQDNLFKDKYWEALEVEKLQTPQDTELLHIPHNGLGQYTDNVKKIITLHDIIPYVLPDTVGVYYHKIFLKTMPHIVDNACRIITVSEHSKKDICNYFKVPSNKVDVIYEAPEVIYQQIDSEKAKKYVAKKYSLSFPYILYLGGFSPRKNVPRLVHAYNKALKQLSNKPKLVIVGKLARNFQEVIDLINKYDLSEHVVFPGYIPVADLPAIYNAAEMFVYPSLYEGFGLPPLEAMACAVPTICSKNSSLPEVVGEGAHLINAEDIDSISDAMIKIGENKDYAAALAEKGKKRAKEFSWQKAAVQTLAAFNKAVKGG